MSYRRITGALWAAAIMLAAVFFGHAWLPSAAFAIAPHVAEMQDPDTCATCHRAHSAAGEVETIETGDNALIIGTFGTAGEGDTQLCYSCHGIESLGAEDSIQSDFELESAHVLAPAASAYGPPSKQCSNCHDSHGGGEEASSAPPAALLRATFGQTNPVYKGDMFCATCHADRANDTWDGLSIWRQTRHAGINPTASGTEVVCSVCHEPHGSSRPPLIVSQITPPSSPATVAVPANDRWLCYSCHPGGSSTYPGGLVMQASGHGSSVATVAAEGEWVSRLATESPSRVRKVGECQNCHAPMGADNGDGAPIAKLASAEGKALCFKCHGVGTTIAEDIASVNPAPTAATLELVSAYSPVAARAAFGSAQLFARASAIATALAGPREYLNGSVGQLDSGDLTGDGIQELVVARTGAPKLSILSYSPLSGLGPVPGDRVLLTQADQLALADVRDDIIDADEIIIAKDDVVSVYRYDPSDTSVDWQSSVTVTGTVPGETPRITGLNTGRLTAGGKDRIVVTADPGAGAPAGTPGYVYVIAEVSGSLTVQASWNSADGSPRGPSVGDIDGDDIGEIAVANGGDATSLGSVYAASGVLRASVGTIAGNERASDTLIANVMPGEGLPGRGGDVVLAVADPTGAASVAAFSEQTTDWNFVASATYALPAFTNPTALAVGDLDGDSELELAVAGAGSFADVTSASTTVIDVNAGGTAWTDAQSFPAEGAQSAGVAPGGASVAIGNLGTIGKSRHPVGTVARTHVSTETVGFARHVECVDCHNPHEATETVPPAGAPNVYGALAGTWGVAVTSDGTSQLLSDARPVANEYEVCFKCHGGWSAAGYTRDIASEVDTRNASVHAIMAPSTTAGNVVNSFVAGWGVDSVLYCKDCHGTDSATGAQGPHASTQSPLLVRGLHGTANQDHNKLCYKCHDHDVYYTGDKDFDDASLFWEPDAVSPKHRRLHRTHTKLLGVGCEACHVSHGSDEAHLLREDIGWEHITSGNGGGACTNGCHSGVRMEYTR